MVLQEVRRSLPDLSVAVILDSFEQRYAVLPHKLLRGLGTMRDSQFNVSISVFTLMNITWLILNISTA